MTAFRSLSIANLHPRLRVDRRAVSAVVATLDAHAGKFRGGCPTGELSLVFLTDTALAQLHGDFLDDPTPTDVITFDGQPTDNSSGEMETVAGEICVSADAARRQTASHRKSAKTHLADSAFSEELTLYIVHGWLHLAGYDDLEPAKKRTMRRAEARAMKLLRQAAPLPTFTLRPRPPNT